MAQYFRILYHHNYGQPVVSYSDRGFPGWHYLEIEFDFINFKRYLMRKIASITDTIIDLGTVISKSVLNLWLKDADMAKDISLGVADILGKK